MTIAIPLTRQQRDAAMHCLEQSLDLHAERVDEHSIQVFDRGDSSLSVSYILIQSAGCAGPSHSNIIHGTLPRSVLTFE